MHWNDLSASQEYKQNKANPNLHMLKRFSQLLCSSAVNDYIYGFTGSLQVLQGETVDTNLKFTNHVEKLVQMEKQVEKNIYLK